MTRDSIPASENRRDFFLDCEAYNVGALRVGADLGSFMIAQRVGVKGEERLWDSLQIQFQKEEDSSLTILVLVHDPRRSKALRIAALRSWPDSAGTDEPSLEVDLEHKEVD